MARQLLDGGMGLWIARDRVSRDEALAGSLHSAYLGAGARALRTPTIELTAALAKGSSPEEVAALARAAFARIDAVTRGRVEPGFRLLFSVGPTGLPFERACDAREAYDRLSAIVREVAAGRALVLLFESFRAADELELALERIAWPEERWVFLAHRRDGNLADTDLASTEGIAKMRRTLDGISVVGVGCHDEGLDLGEALRRLASVAPAELALSLPAFGNGADWAARAHRLAESEPRVAWIGGCCGTGPGHIAALARLEAADRGSAT